MVDKEKCIGCGMCINSCPVNAIKFGTDGKAEIDPGICVKCGTCERVCPMNAIEIKK